MNTYRIALASLLMFAAPPGARVLAQVLETPAARSDVEGVPETEIIFDQAALFTSAQAQLLSTHCQDLIDRRATPVVVTTIPSLGNRSFPGNNIRSTAERLHVVFGQTREPSHRQVWERGLLILVSRGDRVGAIHLGSHWDQRDREKVRRLVQSTLNPLAAEGRFFEAVRDTLVELDDIAALRREPVDSYLSYFVDIEKREWSTQWQLFTNALTSPSLRNPIVQIFVILFGFFLWEWVFPWRKSQRRFREGLGLDLFYTVFSYLFFWALFGTALCTVTSRAFDDFLYQSWGVENLVAVRLTMLPIWLRCVLAVLANEFFSYWIHRFLHHFNWAWEFHKIHHSAQRLDVFNAARLHFGERLIYQFFSYLPMSMVGFEVQEVFYVGLFTAVLSNFTHANVRVPLGLLKYIFNSPQLHLWHHAADYHERGNVNFGDALIVWDFVFGTAYIHKEDVDTSKIRLGFDDVESYPQTFIAQTVLPFKNIANSVIKRVRGWMP